MAEQLIPRAPKRKKQPTAEKLREQLRLAANEIIRLRAQEDWFRYSKPGPWPGGTFAIIGEEGPEILQLPRRAPWWRWLFRRKA